MKASRFRSQEMVLQQCRGNTCRMINVATGQEMYAFCNRRRVCPRCAAIYRYRIAQQLDTLQWEAHAVLTMVPGQDRPTLVDIQRQSQCWLAFASLLRKIWPNFYFAWFREIGPGNRLHLHVLWNISVIDKDLLRSLAQQAGFGHAYVESIHKLGAKPQKAVINYVTKGLKLVCTDRKGAWPPGTRRHQIAAPVSKGPRGRKLWAPSAVVEWGDPSQLADWLGTDAFQQSELPPDTHFNL
jgi:hypothetical protein